MQTATESPRHVGSSDLVRRVAAFEEWISSHPYERSVARFGPDQTRYAWPGQYMDSAVQLAWEAWQQAQNDQTHRPERAGGDIEMQTRAESARSGSVQ